MAKGIAAAEAKKFGEARAQYLAHPNGSGPIRTMIGLAMEAVTPTIRRWAASWLSKTCNVKVTFAEDKVSDHATSPEAAHIR